MDFSLSGSRTLQNFGVRRVTSSSMPVPTEFPDAQGNSLFFGDYTVLSAVDDAHPLWMDTRSPDLVLCPGTGTPGVPPRVCTFTSAPNGPMANDEEIFTASEDVPFREKTKRAGQRFQRELVQFDPIGRYRCLTVQEIKEAHAGHCHRNVGRLEGRGRSEARVEFSAGTLNIGQEGARGADTRRIRNLGDHRFAGCILQDQVVVGVTLQLELGQRVLESKDGSLHWLDAVIGRQGTRRWQRGQGRDGGWSDGLQVDRTSIRVGPSLDGPALYAASNDWRAQRVEYSPPAR